MLANSRKKVLEELCNHDSRCMWHGLKTITDYRCRTPQQICWGESSVQLPTLNCSVYDDLDDLEYPQISIAHAQQNSYVVCCTRWTLDFEDVCVNSGPALPWVFYCWVVFIFQKPPVLGENPKSTKQHCTVHFLSYVYIYYIMFIYLSIYKLSQHSVKTFSTLINTKIKYY